MERLYSLDCSPEPPRLGVVCARQLLALLVRSTLESVSGLWREGAIGLMSAERYAGLKPRDLSAVRVSSSKQPATQLPAFIACTKSISPAFYT